MARSSMQYHAHNLDVSSLKNLAVDLSKRLQVNIRYGFYNHPEIMLPLYDASLKPNSEKLIILDTVNYPEAKETFLLTEDDFIERRLHEKYGDDIVYTKEFQIEYSYYDSAFDYNHPVLKSYREKAQDVCFELNAAENSDYASMVILKHYVWNDMFFYYEWWAFCYSVVGLDFDELREAYRLTVFRYNMMLFILKLGGDTLYVFGADTNICGLIEDDITAEWETTANTIEQNAGNRMVNLSDDDIEKVDIQPYQQSDPELFPLAFKDDYKDIQHLRQLIKEEIVPYEDFYEDPDAILYENLREAKDKQKTYTMALLIDVAIKKVASMPEEQLKALKHILSCVYIWNDSYNEAAKAHEFFLSDKSWCLQNRDETESYLLMIFAKNNVPFVRTLLEQYQLIKEEFDKVYKTYLSAIVDSSSNEHYNIDLIKSYQKLLTVQSQYC